MRRLLRLIDIAPPWQIVAFMSRVMWLISLHGDWRAQLNDSAIYLGLSRM
jgi:hypothetical protein